MSAAGTLSAAASDRKARLAQLKSLKRKAPPSDEPESTNTETLEAAAAAPSSPRPSKSPRPSPPPESQLSTTHLSGRNYDPLTRGPKLGFELNPAAASGTVTLEERAAQMSAEVKAVQEEAAKDEAADAPLDLFKLRPKKANWDLKRDLERRMAPLEVRTENAIARLVRERVEGRKKEAVEKAGNGNGRGDGEDGAEEVGMDGSTLVEATKEREREDEEELRREKEAEAELEAV